MIVPILLVLISLLFLIMWGWIISIFVSNVRVKSKIDELINQPLTVEQKGELDNLQLDLDTNAYRARRAKTVVLIFAILYVLTAVGIVWMNETFALFTYTGLLGNLKLMMLLIVLFFTPGYIGLVVVSNVEGASGDIASRMKFSEELKPGEEVEV